MQFNFLFFSFASNFFDAMRRHLDILLIYYSSFTALYIIYIEFYFFFITR